MIDLTKSIQIFNGDCLEVMKEIPDNSIDLVCIDPPYCTTSETWDKKEVVSEELSLSQKSYERYSQFICMVWCW